jgi:predicted aldo/keto reductase-like oxidoreductase
MKRRDFVKGVIAATLTAALPPSATSSDENSQCMPYRKLGRTGEKVSLIGIGGAHLAVPKTDDEAVRIVRTAIDNGINFMDNSWDYSGGLCEVRMGKALRDGYREKVFLMSKIDGRSGTAVQKQLNESLHRMGTDRLDLLQFHEVIRMSDAERIFAPGGGMEAMLEAKCAGKIRYVGFTGHKSPAIHLHMLRTAFDHGCVFDAVQMPLNVMDAHFDSFEELVLPVLTNHDIGVLGMKPMGASIILNSGAATPLECLHYAMSLPASVIITGCDSIAILQQALNAARTFQPMSESEKTMLLARTAQPSRDGRYEPYKTTHRFDGTYANPQWLG